MNVTYLASLVFLISCFFSFEGSADLFKWVDKNGKVHYSDTKPDERVKSKVVEVEKAVTNNNDIQESFSKAIIRPYDTSTRKLFILDTLYAWRINSGVTPAVKVGAYYVGKGCTSRGAMKIPEVFITHNAFFPRESSNAYSIRKIINSLDYEADKSSKYQLMSNLKKSGGLSLNSEIIDLDFNTCAPYLPKKDRLTAVSKLSSRKFKKHRINLKIRWQLKENRNQDLLYEVITEGNYNGWHTSATAAVAFATAVESATIRLFSDQDFIDKILVENKSKGPVNLDSSQTADDEPVEKSNDQQRAGFFSEFISKGAKGAETALGKSIHKNFVLKARLTQVHADFTQVKMLLAEHFTVTDTWPSSLRETGLSDTAFSDNNSMSDLIIQSDGTIIAELNENFASNKIIQLSPQLEEGSAYMGHRWRCTSNLS